MDIRKVPIGTNPPFEINVLIEVSLRSDPIKYEFHNRVGSWREPDEAHRLIREAIARAETA